MNRYYAMEFWAGRSTTIGTPNKRTGRLSIAGALETFSAKDCRDSWVEESDHRKVVTKKEARSLCLGMGVYEFNEYLELILDATLQWKEK